MNIKLISIVTILVAFVACSNSNSATNGFELTGKFTNGNNQTVVLEKLSTTGVTPVDTAIVDENGEVKMSADIPETGFYRLRISEKNFATLILSPNEKVTIKGDANDLGNTYTVEGSVDSKLFWEVNKASANNYRQRDSIQRYFQAYINMVPPGQQMPQAKIDSLSNALEKPYTLLVDTHNEYLKSFIEKNNSSFAALAAIQQLPSDKFFPTYVKLDEGLFKKYPTSDYIQKFHENVQSEKKLAPGSPAPEITMNTTEDKPLSLSSLKGKVVLVDFWASWCGPCRAENPNVVAAYNKYKSKGFEIFSVSLDKDKDKWMAAIQKDNLTWKSHVCDFKYWQSPVVQLYNFTGIPYNVLLDKKGNIIAKNLRGEELEKKLEEVFK
jgi:thiol-disulfide isomerase/thioredoxin